MVKKALLDSRRSDYWARETRWDRKIAE